jgi:uncharacterized cysteine cluster protein YcgN (CxxCxxCC family)
LIMTTIVVTGTGLFSRPPKEAERANMDAACAQVSDVADRCGTCALRPGTDANNSRLVFLLIDRCLVNGETFMCHHGVPEQDAPTRPCAGFLALKDRSANP